VAADLLQRAAVLGGDARYDVCHPTAARPDDGRTGGAASARLGPRPGGGAPCRFAWDDIRRHVTIVQHPKGPLPLLQMMQTNVCVNDCRYCAFRAGREVRRESFSPDELALLTDRVWRAGIVRGLFLSSGVMGQADRAMERIVATAEILRARYRFTGYLHLKLMPGASEAAVAAAVRLADRVSLNVEAPTAAHLSRLTSTKQLETDLVAPLRRARAVAAAGGRNVSRATQFVVGAAGETDGDILRAADRLYREAGVARAYYSTFNPVPDTPLDRLPAEDPRREHRLYQADFLLRRYRFSVADLPLDAAGRLPRDVDPKLAWARAHQADFPVEVTRADREALLRVPGFGPKTVEALLRARRTAAPRGEADLRRLGANVERARRWITIGGRSAPVQLALALAETVGGEASAGRGQCPVPQHP